MTVKGYGASLQVLEDGLLVTANNAAGKGALGADHIRLTYDDITGFYVKDAKMLTNGALTLGTDRGKVTVHFLKKQAEHFADIAQLLRDVDIPLDPSVTHLRTFSPLVENLRAKAEAHAEARAVADLEKQARRAEQALADAGEKLCPDCAEAVKEAARKCRFCGYEFV